MRLPKRLADHDGLIMVLHLGRKGNPAEYRLYTKHSEQVGSGVLHDDALGFAGARQDAFFAEAGQGYVLKHMVLLFPVERFGNWGILLRTGMNELCFGNCDQLFRMIVGQGPQQKHIQHAEDRAIGADPESEGKNDHGDETRALTETATGEPQILLEGFQPREKAFHDNAPCSTSRPIPSQSSHTSGHPRARSEGQRGRRSLADSGSFARLRPNRSALYSTGE